MINDLAKITTIPVFSLKKLCTNMILCICHRVLENYLNKETETTADIGIGRLNISIQEDEILYKFIPSYKFEQSLIETIDTKKSPLITKAEEILVTKVTNTYKELM